MRVAQREIWWADLGDPIGSSAGFIRPIVIVQNDSINASRLTTYLCVPLTSATQRASVPWNLGLPSAATGLDKDSVAQTTLLQPVSDEQLIERVGRISQRQLERLFDCLDIALGRS